MTPHRNKIAGLVACHGVAFVAIAVALVLMPGCDGLSTFATLTAVWGLIAWLYSRTQGKSWWGWVILLTAFTLQAIVMVGNVYVTTTLKCMSTSYPLFDNRDMSQYFNQALLSDEFLNAYRTRWGYNNMMAMVWELTGVTVVPILIINVFATTWSILLAGVLTRRTLTSVTSWSSGKLQNAGMLATASVAFFLFSGTVLLRESLVGLGVVVMALGAERIFRRDWKIGGLIYVLGATIIILIRASWTPLPFLGLLVFLRRDWRMVAVISAVAAVIGFEWLATEHLLRDYGSMEFYSESTVHDSANFIYNTASHASYNAILGEVFYAAPLYKKLMLMPVAACVQYITPFPWAFGRELSSGPAMALIKLTYGWYIVGGLALYFVIFKIWRAPSLLQSLTLWYVIYWLATVFVSAGSVARYGVPLLPLIVPAVVYAVAQYWRTKQFRIYCAVYAALVVLGLIGCRILMNMDLGGGV